MRGRRFQPSIPEFEEARSGTDARMEKSIASWHRSLRLPFRRRRLTIKRCLKGVIMISGIALLCLLYLHSTGSGPFKQTPKVDESLRSLLEDVLASLEKAVDFFAEDYSGINMDGLYGLRICQGRVLECLQDCASSDFTCPSEVVHRLEVVRNKLKDMTDYALPYVQNEDPPYTFMYIHNIEAPFHVKYIPEWLGDATGPVGNDKGYGGNLGDLCFAGLMGTAFDVNGDLFPKCTIDEVCWDLMSKPDTYDYYITHQLLYFIYGEAIGCTSKQEEILEEFNGRTVREHERDLCGRIFSEAKMLSKEGTVTELKHDLFIEQSMVCGLIGFQDFFSPDWMRLVIGWQTPTGCWTTAQEVFDKEIARLRLQKIQKQLQEQIKLNQDRPTRRRLLEEKRMNGDCLSHLSGLATGTMGVYMRYLIHQLYKLD